MKKFLLIFVFLFLFSSTIIASQTRFISPDERQIDSNRFVRPDSLVFVDTNEFVSDTDERAGSFPIFSINRVFGNRFKNIDLVGGKNISVESNPLNNSLILNVDSTDIDHSDLNGLDDDDHTQYLLSDGTRDLTGDLLVTSSNEINFRQTTEGVKSPSPNVIDLFAQTLINLKIANIIQISTFVGGMILGNNSESATSTISFVTSASDSDFEWNGTNDRYEIPDDLLMETIENLFFRDTSLSINSSVDGQLDIDADTEIEITTPTIDIQGNAFVANGFGLIIGHDAPVGIGGIAEFQVLGTTAPDSSMNFGRWSNNALPPTINFAKSRNLVIGGNTIVNDNDRLGEINFRADDGTDFKTVGAIIRVEVDGTPSQDDMPSRLILGTTSDGANAPTERVRIDSNGDINFSSNFQFRTDGNVTMTSSNGSKFNCGVTDSGVFLCSP